MRHLANSSLQDGIKSALWSVPVARHHLLLHFLVETVHFVCQWKDVAETEGGDTVGEQFVSVQGDRQVKIHSISHIRTVIKGIFKQFVYKILINFYYLPQGQFCVAASEKNKIHINTHMKSKKNMTLKCTMVDNKLRLPPAHRGHLISTGVDSP